MNRIAVMKTFLCFAVLAVAVAACGKSNEVATLQHEANDVAAYYQPKLEALDKRVQLIFKRGTTIPANLPGIEEVGKRLSEARDLITQLRAIVVATGGGKSELAKQAEAAAKARNVRDLKKLIHDTETRLEAGATIINDNLNAVESWIALYDQNKPTAAAAPAPMPEAPAPSPTPAPAPAPAPAPRPAP